jgi:hypothetical protein
MRRDKVGTETIIAEAFLGREDFGQENFSIANTSFW